MAEELVALLKSESKAIASMGGAVLERDKPTFTAALTNLLVSLATEIPVLGVLTEKIVTKVFTNSVNAQFEAELQALQSEAERQRFVGEIAESLEALIGQALIQIIRSQNNLADEQKQAWTRELGGLRNDLARFRSEFAEELTRVGHADMTVRVEQQYVRDGRSGCAYHRGPKSACSSADRTLPAGRGH